MLYDWPVVPTNRTHPRLGTFGEFRGDSANDITRLHSGMDIERFGGKLNVFSPDTGLVRRYGDADSGNPSSGSGPLRIGHFGFNHINNVNAKPGAQFEGEQLPPDLPIYVVEPGAPAFTPRDGIANPRRDADFRQRAVPRNRPVVAFRQVSQDNYEAVTFWPRTLPVGTGVGPTDLHVIYYETADGPYDDGGSVANPLEVLANYSNRKKPIADALVMSTQNGNLRFIGLDQQGQAAIHAAAMGGLDFKLWAHSPFSSKCGVYQIEYEIFMHLGNTTGRLNVWRFHRNPPRDASFVLVDPDLSTFNTVTDKQTVYVISNSRDGAIDAAHHWEIENAALWPDGCYAIRIWLKNINQSVGVGQDPLTNERLYGAEWRVDTLAPDKRKVAVTRRFEERDAGWTPDFPGCDTATGGEDRR